MWRVLIKLTLNWRMMNDHFIQCTRTGMNTLLSKKFAWKINDLSIENLLDPVLNYVHWDCLPHVTSYSKDEILEPYIHICVCSQPIWCDTVVNYKSTCGNLYHNQQIYNHSQWSWRNGVDIRVSLKPRLYGVDFGLDCCIPKNMTGNQRV